MNLGKILQGGGSSDPTVWLRVLDDSPWDWEDHGWVPPQGGLQAEKNQTKNTGAGSWIYPQLDKSMKAVGLKEVDTYVLLFHNNVTLYNATRTTMDLCLAAERRLGARVSMRWWEQAGLKLGQVESEKETYIEEEEGGEGENVYRESEEKGKLGGNWYRNWDIEVK